ncbi:uncharacterized protein METZ01_LOCUS295265, partial [marine metagenome]
MLVILAACSDENSLKAVSLSLEEKPLTQTQT